MKDLLTIDILILQEKNRGIMLKPNLDSKAVNKPGSRYSKYSYNGYPQRIRAKR